MYYVYILLSKKDNQFYTGFTEDLRRRVAEHNKGKVQSTAARRPLQLVYYEGSIDQKDAIHREKYLKTTYGKQYLRNRIKNYLLKAAR